MEYGCIGEKLSHSFSKQIHNQIFDYQYVLKEIPKNELSAFFIERKFKAINVTIPYKQTIIPYLDYIDENAKKIGAVNTVVNKSGKLFGYNTDFSGMRCLIIKNDIEFRDKKVLILGGGGTSNTAFFVAQSLGAAQILRVSRQSKDGFISYSDAINKHSDAQIIINTTPVGMYPQIDNSPIDISNFYALEGVVDAVYNPIRTRLVLQAHKRGIKATGGLYMLVAQAVFAAELFKDISFEENLIDKIYSNILLSKENVVLTGMPSSGKSTLGKKLAAVLNREFIDIDEKIVEYTNKSIPDLFEIGGEEHFRDIESEVIKANATVQGAVISTGGGAILRKENVDLLKQNGRLFYIKRPLEFLTSTDDRPLSSSVQMLKKRFEERKEIYVNTADFILDATEYIEDNVTALKEGFLNENFGY